MNNPKPDPETEARSDPAVACAAAPPGATTAEAEPAPDGALTAEQQMAAFEEALKEEDWGHQPC